MCRSCNPSSALHLRKEGEIDCKRMTIFMEQANCLAQARRDQPAQAEYENSATMKLNAGRRRQHESPNSELITIRKNFGISIAAVDMTVLMLSICRLVNVYGRRSARSCATKSPTGNRSLRIALGMIPTSYGSKGRMWEGGCQGLNVRCPFINSDINLYGK